MTVQQAPNTTLQGPFLFAARVGWIALVILSLAVVALGFPEAVDEISDVCEVPAECSIYQVTSEGLRVLEGLGLSVRTYAVLNVAGFVAYVIGFVAIGALMFWQRSDDWVALLVSATLVGLAVFGFDSPADSLARLHQGWSVINEVLGLLSFLSFFLLLFLFPDGRFVPRWTGLLGLIAGIAFAGLGFATSAFEALETSLEPSVVALMVVLLGVGLYAQVYRYSRVSSHSQRQQTKWVIAGFMGIVLSIFFYILAYTVLFPPDDPDPGRTYFNLIGLPVGVALPLLFPLGIAIAILRYRLWDIDVIINRALVYGALSITLGAVYFGSVVLLQAGFRVVTGQESTLALVASTLAIAGLFQPIRRVVQRVIDRRFYQRKYDAARTLAAFSTTARDEVDLGRLSGALVRVVEDTMQPAHASLWLRGVNAKTQRRG